MDILPKWAYSDNEWSDLVLQSDKIVDGIMYVKKEPDPIDENQVFISNILDML
jgi:hypothetical protein